jgi:hypothetical protein
LEGNLTDMDQFRRDKTCPKEQVERGARPVEADSDKAA